jgi:enoyl-CoA hydratase/carnithine racemase
MKTQTFGYEESDGIATITLDRPERLNALTFEVYAELRDLFPALGARDSVRAIVLTGRGRGFCSGGDVQAIIGELVKRDRPALVEFTRMTGALIANIRKCPKPVVAAVNGVAAGAGAVIALACDFRVAAEGATLAFLFTKIGLTGADMGAAYLLPRVVGLAHATEILFLGDTIDTARAAALGLFTRVVPPDRLMDEARALAARLAARPAAAIGMTKELLNRELDVDFDAAIEAEAQGQATCLEARDFKEAYAAIAAKRAPKFDSRK